VLKVIILQRTWGESSFIRTVVCLTTGSKLLPKRSLHILQCRASSFNRQYPLPSIRSSSSFLGLLPCQSFKNGYSTGNVVQTRGWDFNTGFSMKKKCQQQSTPSNSRVLRGIYDKLKEYGNMMGKF
jgi:hypothetical protein